MISVNRNARLENSLTHRRHTTSIVSYDFLAEGERGENDALAVGILVVVRRRRRGRLYVCRYDSSTCVGILLLPHRQEEVWYMYI